MVTKPLRETIMYSVPGPVVRASVPVERASVIRYAFSSTISFPRSTICTQREVLNCCNIDTNTDEELKLQGTPLQQHRKGKGKSKKTKFTVCQRQELEKTFSRAQYLSPVKRHLLSQTMGISEEAIRIWFKNRRVKWRKELSNTKAEPTTGTVASSSVPNGLQYVYFAHVPYPSSKLMMNDARMLFERSTAHALD